NYVRKRPSNEFEINTKLSVGRWNNSRAVMDVSTPLTESGRWAARFVGVYQDKESWLDHYENDRNVASLVVDGQVGDRVTLAAGYTRQDNNSNGVLWGAVPIMYSSGEQLDIHASTTTTLDWTYWNTLAETAFVEFGWEMSNDWRILSTLTQTDYEEQSEVFYVYWNTGLDPDTGLGIFSYPGKFDGADDTLIWDTMLQGAFNAWGQRHEINLGMSLGDSESKSLDYTALTGFVAMPAFPGWNGNEVPRPAWDEPFLA